MPIWELEDGVARPALTCVNDLLDQAVQLVGALNPWKPFVNQYQPILEVAEAAKILDQNLISFQAGSALHT